MANILHKVHNKFSDIVEGIKYAAQTEIVIGIPEGSGGNGGLSNAELLYLHEHGSGINRIPPRPVLKPALEQKDVLARIRKEIRAGNGEAVKGNKTGADAHYNNAGIIGANACKEYISDGGYLAPNAPITINGGWMRNRVSGKPVYIQGKGSDVPLINSGGMMNSISYEIRKKGSGGTTVAGNPFGSGGEHSRNVKG